MKILFFTSILTAISSIIQLYTFNFAYATRSPAFAFGASLVITTATFLISLAVVITGSADTKGNIHAPRTLGSLVGWTLIFIQGAFTAGKFFNFNSGIEIATAAIAMRGEKIHYVGNGVALLTGEIGPETFRSLKDRFEIQRIEVLQLDSGGGLIGVAEEIGRFLEAKKISTVVTEGCESACVIIALHGKQLYVTPEARFGFHQGSSVSDFESQLGRFISSFATSDLTDELATLGVPQEILEKAKDTPPDSMYYVSGKTLYNLGIAEYLTE